MNHFAVYSKLTQHCKGTLLQLKQKYMTEIIYFSVSEISFRNRKQTKDRIKKSETDPLMDTKKGPTAQ